MTTHPRGIFYNFLNNYILLVNKKSLLISLVISFIFSLVISIIIVFNSESIPLILSAEQVIILFITAITIVFKDSILSFSYIGKMEHILNEAPNISSKYINHSDIKKLNYDDSLKQSAFLDIMAETQVDLNKYKKQTERYKRFFNKFYIISMFLILITVFLYTTELFHNDNIFPKILYIFQYFVVTTWAISVLQIEHQKNLILSSFETDNILHQYKDKMDRVNNQTQSLSEDISILDMNIPS